MATIKDIAKKAGVSVATVSFVLNNRRVTPANRERVLKAIKELNYVPNAAARWLRVRESKTIGLVVSDITNPFYPEIAKACEDVANPLGYAVNIVNSNDSPKRMEQAASQMRDGSIDGMIVSTALEHDRVTLEKLLEEGYPVVLAFRHLPHLPCDTVVPDNERGAEIATQHLIKLGHRRIALMTGTNGSSVSLERMKGYMDSMHEAGLEILSEWIISAGALYENSYQVAKQLLALQDSKRPTAVINVSDMGAFGVMDAVADMGLSIPDDLAVIGFDDLFVSGMRSVQLTTVRIPRYELGKLSTEILLNRIGNSGPEEMKLITLPVELIIRNSCGAKKNK